ncbi:MAG TPA: hypothetical protein VGN08_05760 [Solirubrobacteraceae bacterium]|jgi:hypothetical protein
MWGFESHAIGALPAALLALAPAVAGAATAGATSTASSTRQIAAAAAPAELTIGAKLTVAGVVSVDGEGVAGVQLQLQSEPYPSRSFATIAHATSGAGGSFRFDGLAPERNSRLRVIEDGATGASSRGLRVYVDPAVAIAARRLGPGATRLSMRIRHAIEGGSPSGSALWFTAPRNARVFHLAAVTPTRELAPGVSYASAIVDPPARRFLYRVCLNPAWERAMGRPATHGSCPTHGFRLPADGR